MKKILLFLSIASAILVACSKPVTSEVPPMKVDVLYIATESDTTIRNYVGVVEPEIKVNLSFPLGGTLTELNVRNGERVRAGQRIASVDDTRARALHDAAVATLRQAEDGYERMERVYKEGGISDVRWMQMLTDLEKARQTEISTRQNVEDCHLYAPVDGVVEVRAVSVGSRVAPVETFASVQDLRKMGVRFTIPEQEIGRVQTGDKIDVVLPALSDALLSATVTERSLVANPMGHTYTLRARLERVENVLPGMVAKVRMSHTGNTGVVIPAKCVVTVYDGVIAWVVDADSVVSRRHITVTDFVRNGVLVTDGLQDGDRVVIDGYHKLYPGAKVTF